MTGRFLPADDHPRGRPLGDLIGSPGADAPLLPFTGIRALMLALLDDGVRAYLGPVPGRRFVSMIRNSPASCRSVAGLFFSTS